MHFQESDFRGTFFGDRKASFQSFDSKNFFGRLWGIWKHLRMSPSSADSLKIFFSHSEVEKIDFFHISSIWVNSNQPSWDFGDNQNFDFATNRKSTISDDLEHS